MRIEKCKKNIYFYIRKTFILIYMHKDSKAHSIKNRNKNTVLTKEILASTNSYRKNSENNDENNKKDKDKEEDKEFPLIRINAGNVDDYFPLKSKYILDNYKILVV